MKKVIGEVATLLGSTLLLLTVLLTVVQVIMNSSLIRKDFLSGTELNSINETNLITEADATNELDEEVNKLNSQETTEEPSMETASIASNEPATIAETPSNYHDWTELGSLEEKYSYSTLYYTETTKMSTYWRQVNNIKDEQNHNKHQMQQTNINNGNAIAVKVYQGESVDLLIEDCGIDSDFELFDVVINISNVNSYRKTARFPYSTEVPVEDPNNDYTKPHDDDFMYLSWTVDSQHGDKNNSDFVIMYFVDLPILTDQWNPDSDVKTISSQRGQLINFQLMSIFACCDVTMTYYKHDTYNASSNTGTKANINYITGFYYDIDIPAQTSFPADAAIPFDGAEGIQPLRGSSQFYYDKNNINMNLKDKDDPSKSVQCTLKNMDDRNMR